MELRLKIEDRSYMAVLEDTEAGRRFYEMLPMTLMMSELNGNEKYYYLDQDLPTSSRRPDRIHEGDLMLFGSSCLVLFYKSFSTSYSYTPVGRVENPQGLASALGRGEARVTFTKGE